MRLFVVAHTWQDKVVFYHWVYSDIRKAAAFCTAENERMKDVPGFIRCDFTECELKQ
jgi:hypothetical protein